MTTRILLAHPVSHDGFTVFNVSRTQPQIITSWRLFFLMTQFGINVSIFFLSVRGDAPSLTEFPVRACLMFTACFNRLWLLMSFVRLFAVYGFTFMPVRSVFFCPVQTCGPLTRPPHFSLHQSDPRLSLSSCHCEEDLFPVDSPASVHLNWLDLQWRKTPCDPGSHVRLRVADAH